MGIIGIIVTVTACVGGAAAFVYGAFRRASRVSWAGLQILLLFCYTLAVGAVPVPEGGGAYFWLTVIFFGVVLALVLAAEHLLRSYLLKRTPMGVKKALGRVFGGLLSALNILMLVAVLAGLMLGIVGALPTAPAAFEGALNSALWQGFFSKHFYDLLLAALCFLFVRAGTRLGVLRGIYYLLMFALTFGAALASLLLATKVGFFAGWGTGIAGGFSSLPPAAASALGTGITVIILFIVLFAAVMAIGALLHWGIRKLLNCRPLGAVSALLLGVLCFAVFFAFTCAFDYGIAYLAVSAGQLTEAVGPYVGGVASFLTSSPWSAAIYNFNPFLSLLGA